jgi:short-subunit dehydrogenase
MPDYRRASSANIAPTATAMSERARTMIVTGASSGIGRALALAAARAGYHVVLSARRSGLLDEIAGTIRESGRAGITLAGDITAPEMPARIVEAALRAFERIDAVVNNAGVGAYGLLLDQSDAQLEAQWQLHVMAPLRLARAAAAQLEATRGQLVFIGSGVARVPLPRYGAYSIAKAAVRAAAIQLRRELRPRGIGVTYVDPGVVATEFHSRIGIEPTTFAASSERVAQRILRGIQRRAAVVNGVPWQTAFTTFGEWSGTLADPLVAKHFSARSVLAPNAERNDTDRVTPSPSTPARTGSTTQSRRAEGGFESALEPVARRMERVKLSRGFLRDALVPGATLELNALAMRWAGMPNKNERAALREVLDALTAGGYLERMEDETWRVIRAAD